MENYNDILGRDLFEDPKELEKLEKKALKEKNKELKIVEKAKKKAEEEQQAIASFSDQAKSAPQLTKLYLIRNIHDGTYLYKSGTTIRFKKYKKQGKPGGGTIWKSEADAKKFLTSLLEKPKDRNRPWYFFFDGATAANGGKMVIQNCEIVEHQILETHITGCEELFRDLKSKQLAAQRDALEKEQAKLQKEIDALNKKLDQ